MTRRRAAHVLLTEKGEPEKKDGKDKPIRESPERRESPPPEPVRKPPPPPATLDDKTKGKG